MAPAVETSEENAGNANTEMKLVEIEKLYGISCNLK
jgi:hypothetical protein